jgi:predicted transcriptional regulator
MKDTFSIRIDARTKSEAVAWQFDEIGKGIAELEANQTVPHENVAKWLTTWGTPEETEPPI